MINMAYVWTQFANHNLRMESIDVAYNTVDFNDS
jgi:hypothetical protein